METTTYDPTTFHPTYIPAYPPLSFSPARSSLAEPADWLSVSKHSDKGLLGSSMGAGDQGQQSGTLQRRLKSRHISMISIGGVIGTGLFLGTAQALQKGGPAGLLIGYAFMGIIVCAMMVGLGEMISALPLAGGHITLGRRFVSEPFSLALGWTYYYDWALCLPAELNAAAVLIGYWNSNVNSSVFIAACFVGVVAINLGGTRVYGEAEFWFAGIKIVTIIGLIILGIVIDTGGVPTKDVIGVRYWHTPGPFVEYLDIKGSLGNFLGVVAVFTQAAFSYSGTEIVAIAAAEAQNPKLSLPRAVKIVWLRVLLFYVSSSVIIGLIVASSDVRLGRNDGTAFSSPFVIAIEESGIKVLSHVINAAILASAWSAASSNLFTSSRTLFGMAMNGQAPHIFTRISKWGLPYVALSLSVAVGFLSFMSAGTADAATVFTWLLQMASCSIMCTWCGISLIYLRFYYGARAQGISRDLFPYRAPLQPYAAYFSLSFCLILLFVQGFEVFIDGHWSTATFVTTYLPLVIFAAIYLVGAVRHGHRLVPLEEMDFFSGSRDVDEVATTTNGRAIPRSIFSKTMRSVF